MISDEDLKQLYLNGRRLLDEHWEDPKHPTLQFFRGKGGLIWKDKRLVSCERHMAVFNEFNIIPKYCFDCYKVVITPRNVVELFKLMVVFEKLDLPNDNTRKCLAESRMEISGTYTGLIYCMGIKEGREVLKIAQKVVSEEISEKIVVNLKRGCSEYALAYPKYAKVSQGASAMKYKKKWQKYEDLADKNNYFDNTQPAVGNTFNNPGYTCREAHVMHAWLTYAAAIGDLSYQRISGRVLPPNPQVVRPIPFSPVEE